MEGSLFDLLGAWRVPRVVNHLALLGTAAGRLWRHEEDYFCQEARMDFKFNKPENGNRRPASNTAAWFLRGAVPVFIPSRQGCTAPNQQRRRKAAHGCAMDWEEKVDPKGTTYYVNHATQATQ